MRAEWTKVRTLPSSVWLLVGTVAATVAVSAISISTLGCPVAATCTEDIPKMSLIGVRLGQILVAVFAALAITNEYGTSMIQTTLLTRPRRLRVVASKLVVVTLITLVTAAIAVAISLAITGMVLPGHGVSVRASLGSVLYLGLIAILGFGIGLIVRDTAAAITTVFALLFISPMASMFINHPVWHYRLEKFAPMAAGLAIQTTQGLPALPVQPWTGLGIFACYSLVSVLFGAAVFQLRDA
jgi:ABC-2 type transport system permease protein